MTSELDQLIAEQQKDLRHGNYQSREREVVMSLDQITGKDLSVTDFLTDEGRFYRVPKRLGRSGGCSIHGLSLLKTKPSGGWRCPPCEAERLRQRRRNLGIKPKNFCPHEKRYLHTTPRGKQYCTVCAKARYERKKLDVQVRQ